MFCSVRVKGTNRVRWWTRKISVEQCILVVVSKSDIPVEHLRWGFKLLHYCNQLACHWSNSFNGQSFSREASNFICKIFASAVSFIQPVWLVWNLIANIHSIKLFQELTWSRTLHVDFYEESKFSFFEKVTEQLSASILLIPQILRKSPLVWITSTSKQALWVFTGVSWWLSPSRRCSRDQPQVNFPHLFNRAEPQAGNLL